MKSTVPYPTILDYFSDNKPTFLQSLPLLLKLVMSLFFSSFYFLTFFCLFYLSFLSSFVTFFLFLFFEIFLCIIDASPEPQSLSIYIMLVPLCSILVIDIFKYSKLQLPTFISGGSPYPVTFFWVETVSGHPFFPGPWDWPSILTELTNKISNPSQSPDEVFKTLLSTFIQLLTSLMLSC